MNVVIVGAGNVAWYYAKNLKAAGYIIGQVISRQMAHAEDLAKTVAATAGNNLEEIDKTADVYILAVSDAVLAELNQNLRLGSKLVLHTSGAMPLNIINDISTKTGVLYPLQTMKKDIPNRYPVPLLLEANADDALTALVSIAEKLSGSYSVMPSEKRLQLHLAAVFSNNFINHLAALMSQYCRQQQVDFNLLKPLFSETFSRFATNDPAEIQTGPAIRHDLDTLKLHRSLLKEQPDLLKVYDALTASIMNFYSDKQV